MNILEIVEATQVWSKSGGKSVRKYRCTSGVRKGRVMASPASCNKPISVSKSVNFKKTKRKQQPTMTYKSGIAKRSNPASVRARKLNKIKPKARSRRIKK